MIASRLLAILVGERIPPPEIWIERKMRDARQLFANFPFDEFEIAGILGGLIQTEAEWNAYRSGKERKIGKFVRQLIEGARRNPTMAQAGLLDPGHVMAIRIKSDKVVDFFISSYAESKKVFHLKGIIPLRTIISKLVMPHYKQIILDYRASNHTDVDKRIARGSVLLLAAIMHFASVNESFLYGIGYEEFAWDSTTARFVKNASHLVHAISARFNDIASSQTSNVDALLESIIP